jgi:hypothetical protein
VGFVTHTKVTETINLTLIYFVVIDVVCKWEFGFCELFSALFLDATLLLEGGVYYGEKDLTKS